MSNWQCPNCETINDGDICVICGGNKPVVPIMPVTPPPPAAPTPVVSTPVPTYRDSAPSTSYASSVSTVGTSRLKYGKGFKDAPIYVPDEEVTEHPYVYEEAGTSNAGTIIGIIFGLLAVIAIVAVIAVNS